MNIYYPAYHVYPTLGRVYVPPPGAAEYCDYAVVIDFEATCEHQASEDYKHEIIQFPAVLVEVRTGFIVDSFSTYVRPVLSPKLSSFCTELTGITQAQVDAAPEFPEAMELFEHWLRSHALGSCHRTRFTIVCDSQFDLGKFFYTQCESSQLRYRDYATRWINLKKAYEKFYSAKWCKLTIALEQMGMFFVGRLHNGADDAQNIARILSKMIEQGYVPISNEKILLRKEDQEKNVNTRVRFSLKTVASLSIEESIRLYHRDLSMSNYGYVDSYKENAMNRIQSVVPNHVVNEHPVIIQGSPAKTPTAKETSRDLHKRRANTAGLKVNGANH